MAHLLLLIWQCFAGDRAGRRPAGHRWLISWKAQLRWRNRGENVPSELWLVHGREEEDSTIKEFRISFSWSCGRAGCCGGVTASHGPSSDPDCGCLPKRGSCLVTKTAHSMVGPRGALVVHHTSTQRRRQGASDNVRFYAWSRRRSMHSDMERACRPPPRAPKAPWRAPDASSVRIFGASVHDRCRSVDNARKRH